MFRPLLFFSQSLFLKKSYKLYPLILQKILYLPFFSNQKIIPTSEVGASSSIVHNPPIVVPQIPTNHTMEVPNPPPNRMDAIVATRHAPLVLPRPMNALLAGDYLKYTPKFSGEGEVTSVEHLADFYTYADNLNIEHEDIWMIVFVQSLEGDC